MRKNICIRAEGGAKIGMGHVMRMLELARVLRKDLDVCFVSKYDASHPEEYEAGIFAIKSVGFPVTVITSSDFEQGLLAVKADGLLTDSYDVSEAYFKRMAEHFPISVYMDDENIMRCPYFDVDMLINQNIYASEVTYCTPERTKKLLGLQYLILRDEFIGKPKKPIRPQIENIMITVGGSDDDNLTETIIQQFLSCHYHLRVIIGGAFRYANELKKYSSAEVSLCYNVSMSDCMEWCDAAITSCGATAYEMVAMGVPALGIAVANNQAMCLEAMDRKGLLIRSTLATVGKDIFFLTQDRRQKISDCGRSFVDGQGKYRIANVIKSRMEHSGQENILCTCWNNI